MGRRVQDEPPWKPRASEDSFRIDWRGRARTVGGGPFQRRVRDSMTDHRSTTRQHQEPRLALVFDLEQSGEMIEYGKERKRNSCD